jgi:transposase
MEAVRDYGRPRVDHVTSLGVPSALGLDETSFLKANFSHPTLMVTGFVDLDRHRVIDVVAGHSTKAVTDWLEAKPQRWKRGIRVVALDPFRGYATGIRKGIPHAARSSTTSTPSASPTRRSTRSAAASRTRPSDTAEGRATRCTASAVSSSSATSV